MLILSIVARMQFMLIKLYGSLVTNLALTFSCFQNSDCQIISFYLFSGTLGLNSSSCSIPVLRPEQKWSNLISCWPVAFAWIGTGTQSYSPASIHTVWSHVLRAWWTMSRGRSSVLSAELSTESHTMASRVSLQILLFRNFWNYMQKSQVKSFEWFSTNNWNLIFVDLTWSFMFKSSWCHR